MTAVYRLLRRPYSRTPLDGEGAHLFGGRWSSPGTRIVYTSKHLSLAMLEYFVHLDPNDPPKDLVLVAIDIPRNVPRVSISLRQLPRNWRQTPAPPELARFGDNFVRDGRATVMTVPSALAPTELNWLINPLHAGFSKIRIRSAESFDYDPRFFA